MSNDQGRQAGFFGRVFGQKKSPSKPKRSNSARKGNFWGSKPPKVPGNIKQIRGAAYPPSSPLSREPSADSKTPNGLYTTPAQEKAQSQAQRTAPSSPGLSDRDSVDTPNAHQRRTNRRTKKTNTLLGAANMNMADLREISWSGLPVHVRSIVWQILLGYMPSNKQRRGPTLTRRRQEYYRYVNQHWADDSTLDEKAIKQIRKDVPRLCPGVPLFQHQKVRESMERVLYIFAVRFTASGYVQGIDDLCVPFYVTFLLKLLREDNCCLSIQELTVELNAAFSDTGFPRLIAPLIVSYLSASHLPPDQELKYLMDSIDPNAITEEQFENTEADSFFCMTQLIRGIQDHYIFAQPGIQKSVHKLSEIVKCIDGELHNHLLTENIQFMQFAYRWMNNLLMRELPLVLVIRVWDTYMAEQNDGGFKIFHIYTCAALIMRWAKKLKAMGFQDLVMFLQHLPTDDWTIKDIDALLSQAFVYKSLYEGARAHMQ